MILIMEKKMDPQHLVLEPGARVTLPVTLTVPPNAGQHYTVNVQIRVTTEHAVEMPPWEPVALEGMPPYAEASAWGVRALRDAARARGLAPHRTVGSMSRGELLELLYRPPAPEPTAEIALDRALPDNTAPAEQVEKKERPRKLKPYARINNSKVLHLSSCGRVVTAVAAGRPIVELTKIQANRGWEKGELNSCGSCKPEWTFS